VVLLKDKSWLALVFYVINLKCFFARMLQKVKSLLKVQCLTQTLLLQYQAMLP
jgi:hypothetical protein